MEGQFFKGEHVAHLDGKGRIGIPVDWRPLLQGDERAIFYAYPSVKSPENAENAVRCLSSERLARLNNQVQQMPTFAPQRQVVEGLILSRVKAHNLDGQGRTVLNTDILSEAGIGDEMVLVGFGDHFQIWDPAKLADYRARLAQSVLEGHHPDLQSMHI